MASVTFEFWGDDQIRITRTATYFNHDNTSGLPAVFTEEDTATVPADILRRMYGDVLCYDRQVIKPEAETVLFYSAPSPDAYRYDCWTFKLIIPFSPGETRFMISGVARRRENGPAVSNMYEEIDLKISDLDGLRDLVGTPKIPTVPKGWDVVVDITTSPMTLKEAIETAKLYGQLNPDMDVFMDGDAYAIVGAPKR